MNGSEELDFTSDDAKASGTAFAVGGDYDPRPQADAARRNIAYLLIVLLWFVVVGIFFLVGGQAVQISEVKEFAVILGPIVALVSAATGFYYGTKSNE